MGRNKTKIRTGIRNHFHPEARKGSKMPKEYLNISPTTREGDKNSLNVIQCEYSLTASCKLRYLIHQRYLTY